MATELQGSQGQTMMNESFHKQCKRLGSDQILADCNEFSSLSLSLFLDYNCFTMLCQFLLYNKVNQLYVYIYRLSLDVCIHIFPLSSTSHSSFFHNYDDLPEDHQGRDNYIFERAPTFACCVGLFSCRVCLMDNSWRCELLYPHSTHLGHYRAPS